MEHKAANLLKYLIFKIPSHLKRASITVCKILMSAVNSNRSKPVLYSSTVAKRMTWGGIHVIATSILLLLSQ